MIRWLLTGVLGKINSIWKLRVNRRNFVKTFFLSFIYVCFSQQLKIVLNTQLYRSNRCVWMDLLHNWQIYFPPHMRFTLNSLSFFRFWYFFLLFTLCKISLFQSNKSDHFSVFFFWSVWYFSFLFYFSRNQIDWKFVEVMGSDCVQ